MRNFETPKMNISMFAVEDVVTTSGEVKTDAEKQAEVKSFITERSAMTNVDATLGFSF